MDYKKDTMLSTNMFIITPFYREQIVITGFYTEDPEIPFTSYSVYVFRTRLSSFLKKYFNVTGRKKYKYYNFVFFDIPSEGRMITTIQLIDVNDNKIQLTSQEIRDINQEISQMINLHPDYFLFFSDTDLPLSQPWLRLILPSFKFERTSYYPDDSSKTFEIDTIYNYGELYLDLSQDPNFYKTIDRLYANFIQSLYDYYFTGTIPQFVEIISNDITNMERIRGEFIHFKDKLGDQVLEDLADIKNVTFPISDSMFVSEKKPIQKDIASVFVLNFTSVDPEMNIFIDPIGVEFLVSLKKFLKADDIFIQEGADGYYEIELKKDDKFIQSNLNIKEMFGYFYFTDHPLGLLVAEDLGLLEDSKIIYDSLSQNSVTGRGGLFIPMIHMDEPVEKELLEIKLNNRKQYIDVYTKSPEIELLLNKFGLKIISNIDQYLFVEKNQFFTKRVVYRGLSEDPPNLLLSGSWSFDKINPSIVIDITKEFLKEKNLKDREVREGPFSTIVVSMDNISLTKELLNYIEERLYLKYTPARKF